MSGMHEAEWQGHLEEFHANKQKFYKTIDPVTRLPIYPPREQWRLPSHLKPRKGYCEGMAAYHDDMRAYHKGERLRLLAERDKEKSNQ